MYKQSIYYHIIPLQKNLAYHKKNTQKMQYINVSQFYQSILCFSIPLLIIQRVILFFFDLSNRYQDYRRMFYQDQFQFTKEYQYHVQNNQKQIAKQSNMKDQMLDKKQQNSIYQKNQNYNNEYSEGMQSRRQEENRHRAQSFKNQDQISCKNPIQTQSINNVDQSMKRKIKINIDLQTDKQLINSKTPPPINKQLSSIQQKSPQNIPHKQTQIKIQIQQSQMQGIPKAQQNNKKQENIQQLRISRLTQSDIQVRRQTQLDQDLTSHLDNRDSDLNKQNIEKQTIELGRGKLLQKGQKDKIKLRFCRRVDDAFNDYVPIIMSIVVLGIITQSVYIYSMVCFFGYAFSALLFNYAHLLDKLEGALNQTKFGRINQLISSLFIIGLVISYWVSNQFY